MIVSTPVSILLIQIQHVNLLFFFLSGTKLEITVEIARKIIETDQMLDRLVMTLAEIELLRIDLYEDAISVCYQALKGKVPEGELLQ